MIPGCQVEPVSTAPAQEAASRAAYGYRDRRLGYTHRCQTPGILQRACSPSRLRLRRTI